MKVSLVSNNLLPGDAVGDNLVRKARFFRQGGHQVRVFLGERPRRPPPDLRELCVTCALGELKDRPARGNPAVAHFWASDLVSYEYPVWYPLVESIRWLQQGAVLFDYHGVTPPALLGEWETLLWRSTWGARLAHWAHLSVVHSAFARDELVSHAGLPHERIRVLPLGVEVDRLSSATRDRRLASRYGLDGCRVVLYVGRMARNKRVDLLVRALGLLADEMPDLRLLLVGDDRGAPAYARVAAETRHLARQLGVFERVIFTGWVPDVTLYYALADVFATASLHEGFGAPVVEAMAAGVPVVVSASGALPETVGEAGLIFAPADAGDLAGKLRQVLTNDGLRQRLREAGRRRARAFDQARFEAGLQAIVDEVLERTREGRPAGLPEQDDGLEKLGDVALRDHAVRSQVPVLGPLIAWLRRNLTSHVKEAYLDQIVERQVMFNQALLSELRQVQAELEALRREAGDDAAARSFPSEVAITIDERADASEVDQQDTQE